MTRLVACTTPTDLDLRAQPVLNQQGCGGVVFKHDNLRYLSAWPDAALLDLCLSRMADEAGVTLTKLPEGLRIRRTASHIFAFNYANAPTNAAGLGSGAPVIGETVLAPAGVAVWARS